MGPESKLLAQGHRPEPDSGLRTQNLVLLPPHLYWLEVEDRGLLPGSISCAKLILTCPCLWMGVL